MPDEDKKSDAVVVDAPAEAAVPDAEVIEDPVVAPPPEPVAPSPPRRSSVFPALLGGVLAAAAGFGAAQLVPQGWPLGNTDALRQEIADQAAEIATLQTRLEELAARPAADVSSQIATLRGEVEQRLNSLPSPADPGPDLAALRQTVDDALAALDARLQQVEKAPAGTAGGASATAVAAYERDLQALRAQVEQLAGAGGQASSAIEQAVSEAKADLAAAAAEAERLQSEAAAAARVARRDAALGRLEAAIESGGPFASALSDLTEAGVAVPPVLTEAAPTGIETLPELQRSFPAAARAGLDAALRADVGEGWDERLTTFLRTQTGARSLEPREGDDPDAILSRAEAALQLGDLPAALAEVATLPEPARAAMADWIVAADRRQQAEAAVQTVATAADTQ